MKRFRLLLIVAGALAALLVVAVLVAFSGGFQTWAAHRYLAAHPELGTRIGSVRAGLGQVALRDVRVEQDGAILQLPAVEADLPLLSAALSEKVKVSRLIAKNWNLDLSKLGERSAGAASRSPAATPPSASGAAAGGPTPAPRAPARAAAAFAGIFSQLRLPVDLAVDGVELDGTVVLPESRGSVKVSLRGGGLAPSRDGKFDVAADATLADPAVNAVRVRGTLVGGMDTPRSFTHLALKFDASASGTQFPQGVSLTAGVTAARAATGETYSATLVTHERQLVALKADFPRDASRLDGTWKLDVRNADLAPFALGHPLPVFNVIGEGKFDTDAAFAAVHATGRINATAGKLEVVKRELVGIESVRVVAEFDLTQRGPAVAVQQLEATISGAQPVATVRALQGFEFNPQTGALHANDPARELVGIVLQGVPLAWAKPFFTGMEISGSDLRGELVATPRGGGVTVRSRTPLIVERLGASQTGKALAKDIDVSLGLTADYTPQGWQTEVTGLSARSGGALLFTVDGKAGQLAGKGQPLKATAKIAANFPAALRQPALSGLLALTSGDATIDLAASVGEKQEVQARVALSNLATTVEQKPVTLPTVVADLRADLDANGELALNLPLVLERNGRKSDVALVGKLGPEKDKSRAIEAQLTSTLLVIDDAKALAVVLPTAPESADQTKSSDKSPTAGPPWAGFHGSIALQLKKVVYSDAFEMTNVGGRLRLDAGVLKLETVQLGLGETGRLALNGRVKFEPKVPRPFALEADLSVRDFDPGPLFQAFAGKSPATVEGRFDVTSKLVGRASTLDDLPGATGGQFQLTSKGGVFRGLPVNAATLAENTSRFASWIASAGTAIGALAGKKETNDIANKAQAIGEIAKALSGVAYDQLSVLVSRDEALNATLQDFSLISPELRLTGSGTVTHTPGTAFLDDALSMEFKLRARGRQADLLRYVGALEAQTDDLGYSSSTLPLKVAGTLGKPDTTELNAKLATLAVDRSGVTEKASELFNRIIGGGGK